MEPSLFEKYYIPKPVPEAEKNLYRQNSELIQKAVRVFGLQSEQVASEIPPESLRYGTKSLTGQLRYELELMDRTEKRGNPYNPDYDIDPRATPEYSTAKLVSKSQNRPMSELEEKELATKIQSKYDTSNPENLLDEKVFRWALYREPTEQGQRAIIDARNNTFIQSWTDAQKEQFLAQEAAKSIEEAKKASFFSLNSRFAKALGKGTMTAAGGFRRTLEEVYGVEGGKAYANKMAEYANSAGLTTSEADGVLSFAADVIGSAIPFAVGAATGGIFGFIPGLLTLAATSFSMEGENAYQEAIQGGAKEDEAQNIRINVGFINTAIEGLQLGTIFNFAKAGRGSRQALIAGILNKARKRGLKKFTGETARMLFDEGVQEFAQEVTSVGVPGFMYGRWPANKDGSIDMKAIRNRLGAAFLGGVTMGAVLGSGGRMMNRILYGKAPDFVGMNTAPVHDWKYAIRTPEEQAADKPYLDILNTPKENEKGTGFKPSKFVTAAVAKGQRMGENFGNKVIIFDDPLQEYQEGFMFEGAPGIIYLSSNATEAASRTVGHEFAHIVKISDPEAYMAIAAIAKKNTKRADKLRKYYSELFTHSEMAERRSRAIKDLVNEDVERSIAEQMVDEQFKAYGADKIEAEARAKTEASVDDELVSEFVGSLFENTKIAEQIGKASPNFLSKINDYIQDTIDRMVGLQNMMDIDEYRVNWRESMYKVAEILGNLQQPTAVEPASEMGKKAASVKKPSIRKPQKPEGVKKQAGIVVKRKFGKQSQPYQQTFGQFFNRIEAGETEYGVGNAWTSHKEALKEWLAEVRGSIKEGRPLRPAVQDSLATNEPALWIDTFRTRPELLEGYIPMEIIRFDVISEQQLLEYKRKAKEYRGQKRPSIRKEIAAQQIKAVKTEATAKLKAKFKSATGTDSLSGDKYLVTPDGYVVKVLKEHNVTGHDAGTTLGEMMGEQILYASRYRGNLAMLANGPLSSEQKIWLEQYIAFNSVNYLDLTFWSGEKKNYERFPVDFSTSTTIRKGVNTIQGYLDGTIAPTVRELPRGFMPSIRKGKAKQLVKTKIRAQIYAAVEGRSGQPAKMVEESVALKSKLKAMQKASIDGYKAGAEAVKLVLEEYKKGIKEGKAIRKFLRKTVQKSLPLKERGRMLRLVETTETDEALIKSLEKLKAYYEKHLKNIQKARIKKILRLLSKYKRSGKGGGAGYRMLPDIEEAVRAIVDGFRMTTPSVKAAEAAVDLYEMAQTVADTAKERGMSDPFTQFEVFDFLKRLETTMSKVPVDMMSSEELENLANSLLILIHQHETEMAVMSDEKIKRQDEMREVIIEEIRSGWRKEQPVQDKYSTKDKKPRWKWWTGLFGRHSMNLATLSRIAAGMKKDSITEEVFSENLVRGVETTLEHFYTIQDLILDLMKEKGITEDDIRSWSKYTKRSPGFLGFANWIERKTGATLNILKKFDPDTMYVTVRLKEGKELMVTVGEALDIYMHTKNAYNYKVLTGKNGVEISGIKVPQLAHDDINNIIAELDRVTEGKATLFADILTEAIKVQADAINEVSLRIYGYELANRPGYWHIRRKLPPQAKGPQQEFAYETIESRSHFKEITGGVQPLYIGDALNNFVDTLNVGSDFIGLAEPMRTARMFIGDTGIQDMMTKKGYESYIHEIIAKLNNIESRYAKQGVLARMVGKLQRNLTRAFFSYSPRLAVQQYFSITLAQDELDWKYLKEIRFFMDKETRAEIYSHSYYFRQRFEGNISREMGDVAHSGSVLQFFTKKELYANRPTAMVRNWDMRAVFDIWRMSKAVIYDEQVATGEIVQGSVRYWEEVTKLAERIVRKTQPTWHKVDRSMLGSTEDPISKSLTMFHSQREKMMQMVHEANSRYANSKRTPADFLRLSKTYGIVLMNLALVDIWNEVYKWVVLGADEDPAAIVETFIGDIPGLIYFVGPVSRDALIGAIRTFRGKQTFARGELSFPPNRVAKLTAESAVAWARWFNYAVNDTGDADAAIAKAMGTTFELSNYMFGLPFLEITKTLKANYKRFSE
jgi:hypothetical protein